MEDEDATQGLFVVLYSSHIHKIRHAGADRGFTSMSFVQDGRGIDF